MIVFLPCSSEVQLTKMLLGFMSMNKLEWLVKFYQHQLLVIGKARTSMEPALGV